MAKKARSLNPADAFRKAQRQKEIKRNKLDRKKAREGAHTKKDSAAIQAEISQLERLSKRTTSEEKRLTELKNELSVIYKAKEQNGSASSSVRPSTQVIIDPATGLAAASGGNGRDETAQDHNLNSSKPLKFMPNSRSMNWFGPDGKLLEPERSFYYDPVFNPFGVPPPGMPVQMKDPSDFPPRALPINLDHSVVDHGGKEINDNQGSPSQVSQVDGIPDQQESTNYASDENESEEENTDNDDDDIPLPEGPPPGDKSEDETDDEIPLPEGPPPPKPIQQTLPEPLIHQPQQHPHPASLPHPGFTHPQPLFPPCISLVPGVPPPPIIAGFGTMPFPLGPNGLPLPLPPMNRFHPLPPPPPSSMKLPAKPNMIPKPLTNSSLAPNPKPSIQASATVSALPQLRDLKREATSFVPAAIWKKKKELDRRAGLAGLGDSNRIQAAPEAFDEPHTLSDLPHPPNSLHPKQVTTSLLDTLKQNGILPHPKLSNTLSPIPPPEKDNYEKFVKSLGDFL